MAGRRRRPILAALLSLLWIGLGDAYNGSAARGARLLAMALIASLVLATLWSVSTAIHAAAMPPHSLLLGYIAAPVAARVFGMVRAWRDARRFGVSPRSAHVLRTCVIYVLCAEAAGFVINAAIRTTEVQAFKIPSGAMQPTLQVGDHVLVNKLVYGPQLEVPFTAVAASKLPGLRKPQPGDVVVFVWPKDRSKIFIKRVIAVEGETIEVRAKQVYVDGQRRDDSHATYSDRPSAGDSYGPYTVPTATIFVMGDNRDQSYDSRFWGPVPLADVKGKALIIYWSWGTPDRWVRWDRIARLVY